MKLTKNLVVTLSILGLSSPAFAQTTQPQRVVIKGTNAAAEVIDKLVNPTGELANLLREGECGRIDYPIFADGSAEGEKALCEGKQIVAPMIRRFDAAICNTACKSRVTGASQALMIDSAVVVVRNNGANDATCDTAITTGDDASATSAVNLLKIIYAGVDGSGSQAACNDPVRLNLVNNWGKIWNNDCASGSCSELHHAFRRADIADVTQRFNLLAGITGFCNGKEGEDKDPVRRSCRSEETFCGADGTLGLVLPIVIDAKTGAAADEIHNSKSCAIQSFASAAAKLEFNAQGLPVFVCPYGTVDDPRDIAGNCLYPVDAEGKFGCLAASGFFNLPIVADSNFDARAYNRVARRKDGRAINPSNGEGLFYRLVSGCNEGLNVTSQIGCMVNSNDCSVGMADSRAHRAWSTRNEKAATATLDGEAYTTDKYPLPLDVRLATLKGYADTVRDEARLTECILDLDKQGKLGGKTILQYAVEQVGFESVPRQTTLFSTINYTFQCQ